MPHIDSFYSATRTDSAAFGPITQDVEIDVCVVGGGLAGLTAAHELLALGKSVCVLEGEEIGWGASGRNGGFVSDGYAEGLDVLEKKLGKDHAVQLFRISQEGTQYVKNMLSQLSPAQAPMGTNWLSVMRHDVGDQLETKVEQLNRNYPTNYRAVSKDEVRSVLKSDTYFQGIEDGNAIHIHPLNYAQGLADKIRKRGGKIYTQSPAVALHKRNAGFGVETANGRTVACGQVILCGSAYMKNLYPKIESAVLPVATYVVTSEKMPEQLASAITYRGCISDTRRAGDYYRLVDDCARLLWGGRITTQKSEPHALGDMLKQDIVRIYPQLHDMKINYAWSGLMGYCVHKMPVLRELEPGIWTATATGGHGLNSTAAIGKVVAEAVAGTSDRYKLFAPFTAQWGGGPVGRAATQAAYWGLQLQDWWDEKKNRG